MNNKNTCMVDYHNMHQFVERKLNLLGPSAKYGNHLPLLKDRCQKVKDLDLRSDHELVYLLSPPPQGFIGGSSYMSLLSLYADYVVSHVSSIQVKQIFVYGFKQVIYYIYIDINYLTLRNKFLQFCETLKCVNHYRKTTQLQQPDEP